MGLFLPASLGLALTKEGDCKTPRVKAEVGVGSGGGMEAGEDCLLESKFMILLWKRLSYIL